jgi:signal transduction histidine kinase
MQIYETELEAQNEELLQSKLFLQESHNKLELLTDALNHAEMQERRRIAMLIHDQVVQRLAFSKMSLDTAVSKGDIPGHPLLEELSASLETAMNDLRDLSSDLSPPELYDIGLKSAISSMGERLSLKFGFNFTLLDGSFKEDTLSKELKANIFQFFSELLSNVVKHSKAINVSVKLILENGLLTMNVKDDGIGFNPGNCTYGFGLQMLRQRVAYLCGEYQLESMLGIGTHTCITITV